MAVAAITATLAEVIVWRARARPLRSRAAGSALVDARERLGDADRLVAALALERDLDGHLRAARDVLERLELRVHADTAADGQRRREADLVEPVVDREREALQREDLLGEHGRERQGVVAVGDRAAERRRLRALRIDVDPLVVAGHVGE